MERTASRGKGRGGWRRFLAPHVRFRLSRRLWRNLFRGTYQHRQQKKQHIVKRGFGANTKNVHAQQHRSTVACTRGLAPSRLPTGYSGKCNVRSSSPLSDLVNNIKSTPHSSDIVVTLLAAEASPLAADRWKSGLPSRPAQEQLNATRLPLLRRKQVDTGH